MSYEENSRVYSAGTKPFVFVSYSHSDKFALQIIDKLIDSGYRVWYDSGLSEHGGQAWTQIITGKVRSCSVFVVLLSANSLASPHVVAEMSIAFERPRTKYKFIPIWITNPISVANTEPEYYLRSTQVLLQDPDSDHSLESIFNLLDKNIFDSCSDRTKISDGGVLESLQEHSHDLDLGEQKNVRVIGPKACKDQLELETVYIPEWLEEIGDEAFRNCPKITHIYIPESVKRIGDSCFRDCTSLQKLTIKGDVEIGERAFENCGKLSEIELPDNLAEIYNGVFNSCKSLTKIKLPKHLSAIGDSAFASCDHLVDIEIPVGVTRIDDQVFAGCSQLAEIKIPNTVTRIGKNVFKDCVSLKSIHIPESVKKMDSGCFRGCTALEKIEVDFKNRYFKDMDGVMFNKNKSTLISYPSQKLDSIYSIPDSVTVIEDWAFSDSPHLEEVEIKDSVEHIGEGAFFRCENLRKLFIPYSVDVIQDTAFRGCSNLKEVKIESESFKDLGWGLFYGCPSDIAIYSDAKQIINYCKERGLTCHKYKR